MLLSRDVVERVQKLVQLASDQILSFYNSAAVSVDYKSDQSPITDADRSSHLLLTRELGKLHLGPVVSEEGRYVQQTGPYWLIDPLDGTRDFVERSGEFAINVSYMVEGQPVFGLIHAPVTKQTCWALRAEGAFLEGKPLPRREARSSEWDALDSRFHKDPIVAEHYELWGVKRTVQMGSSLKFIEFAAGRADVYLRNTPTCEWDTAAGQLICEEVGGVLWDLTAGRPMRYNRPDPKNGPFVLGLKGQTLEYQGRKITL